MKNRQIISTHLTPESTDILKQAEHQARRSTTITSAPSTSCSPSADSDNDAAHVLQSLGVTAGRVRAEIASLVTPGPQPVTREIRSR